MTYRLKEINIKNLKPAMSDVTRGGGGRHPVESTWNIKDIKLSSQDTVMRTTCVLRS